MQDGVIERWKMELFSRWKMGVILEMEDGVVERWKMEL